MDMYTHLRPERGTGEMFQGPWVLGDCLVEEQESPGRGREERLWGDADVSSAQGAPREHVGLFEMLPVASKPPSSWASLPMPQAPSAGLRVENKIAEQIP